MASTGITFTGDLRAAAAPRLAVPRVCELLRLRRDSPSLKCPMERRSRARFRERGVAGATVFKAAAA
eukprot:scaffold10926_cov163-Amphora_coffeaeformis.AAC.9